MMTIYTFETIDNTDWNDYGSTHFNVIASSEREAWKKACEIEHRENIIGIIRYRVIEF